MNRSPPVPEAEPPRFVFLCNRPTMAQVADWMMMPPPLSGTRWGTDCGRSVRGLWPEIGICSGHGGERVLPERSHQLNEGAALSVS